LKKNPVHRPASWLLALATASRLSSATAQTEPAASPAPEAAIPAAAGDAALPEPPPIGELFPTPGQEPPADLSANVTINLLKLMVKRNLISETEAVGLIQQAQTEAETARTQQAASTAAAAAQEDESMRVSYVPEAVRQQMKDEVRNSLLHDLNLEPTGPGKDSALVLKKPEKEKTDLFGDIRLRYELVSYPEGNDNTGAFPNFNAINTGQPFDVAGTVFSPQYNVDQERMRYRLRARFGGHWELEDGWSTGVRIATGENNSPTTTNQSVGLASQGQGGNFSKYSIWLDRAFIRYQRELGKGISADVYGGRFENPFFSTDSIFDEDLGFDGLAVKLKSKVGHFSPFFTAGIFPIFNTDMNFSSNQPAKFESTDKYLYGVQVGTDVKLGSKWNARVGGAYYLFDGVEGKASTPYLPLAASDAGDTDNTRPSFAQKGNTYRPLRTIIPDPLNNFGTASQFQYFGLATPFEPISLTAKFDYSGFEPITVSLIGEYIYNTAWDRASIDSIAVNNRGPLAVDPVTGQANGLGAYDGDNYAWSVGLKFGHPVLNQFGKWNATVGYRWLGSDAVVDGFNDSEFGGGGTNMKGFAIGASMALSEHAIFGVSWMSADQIAGPPLKIDSLQVDLKISF
jgi:Putative porin